MTLTARRYSPRDFGACVDLFRENQVPYFADHEFEQFERFLKSGTEAEPFFLFFVDDRLVACGGYSCASDCVYLNWGMVRREEQRKGFGRIMVDFRLARIREEHPNLAVRIDTSQHTMEFYKRMGFAVISIERDGYTQGLDKVIMEKAEANQALQTTPTAPA